MSDFKTQHQTAECLSAAPHRRVSSAKKYKEQVDGGSAEAGGPSVTKRSRSPSPRKGRSQGDQGHSKRSRREEEAVKEEGLRRSSSPLLERRQGGGQWACSSDSRPQSEEQAVLDTATPTGKEALAGQESCTCSCLK